MAFIGVVVSLVVGTIYVVVQWIRRSDVADPLFVGILMANDFLIFSILKFFTVSLRAHGRELEAGLDRYSDHLSVSTMLDAMFAVTRGGIVAVLFGSIFFLGVLLLQIAWEADSALRLLLATFLFTSNFVTGLGIFSLVKFFRIALRLRGHVRVELFDRSCPVTQFLMWASRRVVQATAFISCLAMLSLLFSVFKLDFSTVLFSIWTVTLLSVAYLVPLIPISNRLAILKGNELRRLGLLIQEQYALLMAQSSNPSATVEMERFEVLDTLNKKISKIRVFPPVGSKSVETALFVTFLTLLPSLIEFFLNFLR